MRLAPPATGTAIKVYVRLALPPPLMVGGSSEIMVAESLATTLEIVGAEGRLQGSWFRGHLVEPGSGDRPRIKNCNGDHDMIADRTAGAHEHRVAGAGSASAISIVGRTNKRVDGVGLEAGSNVRDGHLQRNEDGCSSSHSQKADSP